MKYTTQSARHGSTPNYNYDLKEDWVECAVSVRATTVLITFKGSKQYTLWVSIISYCRTEPIIHSKKNKQANDKQTKLTIS